MFARRKRNFLPKAVVILLKAFDDVVAELDLQTRADWEQAAKIVMRLATGQGHRWCKAPQRRRRRDAKRNALAQATLALHAAVIGQFVESMFEK